MKRTQRLIALTGFALFMCAACRSNTTDPRTEVLVEIYADTQVKKAADKLIVDMMSGPPGQSGADATQLTAGDPEVFDMSVPDFQWPAKLALLAKPAHEDYAFELTLRLEKRGVAIARGRVRSAFVKGQTLLLQTSLSAECLGKLDCADDQTCVVSDGRATCESASVDAGSLPRVGGSLNPNDAGTRGQDASMSRDAGSQPPGDASAGGAQDASTGCSTQTEVCDNGIDDNCNGAVDCADSACTAITQCVPNATAFVVVAHDASCPAGYDFREYLYQGLQDPGCSGCSCQPDPKECSAYVFVYADATSCDADQKPYSQGQQYSQAITKTCSMPVTQNLGLNAGGGFRVLVKAPPDTCSTSGDPMPLPPVWSSKLKLCAAQLQRHGCHVGQFCAPVRDSPKPCWTAATAGCPNPLVTRTWWHDYDDKRTCQACACQAKDGSCADLGVVLDPDPTCSPTSSPALHDGEKSCDPVAVDARARAVGAPKNPTCEIVSGTDGELVPTLPLNLCCPP